MLSTIAQNTAVEKLDVEQQKAIKGGSIIIADTTMT